MNAPRPSRPLPPARPRRQRGISLIDGLIAIAILSFGLIGLTRMQGRMVGAATDAQLRTTAMALADEILNTAHVDDFVNAACYTLPAAGGCGNATAAANTAAWGTRVSAALPGTVTRTVTLNAGTGRMTVTIGWTSREADADGTRLARQFSVVSDVR